MYHLKKKRKNYISLVLDFKSYILCKLKWSYLHQDIKSLHSMWVSRICWVRSQKTLCLQLNVLLDCVLSPLEKNLSGRSLRAFLMVQKTALLLWNRRGAPVCVLLLMLCFDPAMGDRGESAHGAALLWPGWALVTRAKLALLHIYIYIYLFL